MAQKSTEGCMKGKPGVKIRLECMFLSEWCGKLERCRSAVGRVWYLDSARFICLICDGISVQEILLQY